MAVLKIPVTSTDHFQGPESAPLTLVEYGDYECPYCGRAYPIIKRVQAHFGERLRFVFRNFPLTEIHPHALHAAVAAESGGPRAANDASRVGADAAAVLRDLESDALQSRVREDFMSGVKSGVNGTPTFFINGRRYDGSWDEASL